MKELQRDFEVRYQHAQATSMSRRDAHMEVDLHIHELVDDQRGLADGAKLAIQMAHFDRMMDIAKREKLRRIVFIHGVGQGCCVTKFGPHSTSIIPTATTVRGIRGGTVLAQPKSGWGKLLGASPDEHLGQFPRRRPLGSRYSRLLPSLAFLTGTSLTNATGLCAIRARRS